MGTIYSRSLPPKIARNNQNPSDNKKVYQRNSLLSIVTSLLPIFVVFCWSHEAAGQTSYSKTREASASSEVSVGELSVPRQVWSRLRAADKALRQGDQSKALKETDRALQMDPGCAAAFTMKAFIDLAAKQPAAAIEHANRAIGMDPHGADAYIALAMASNSVADFAQAQRAAQHALALRPDSWQGRLELAKGLYGEGLLQAALAELNGIGRDFPDIHLVKGNVLLRLGLTSEGAAELTHFLEEAPHDLRAGAIQQIVSQQIVLQTDSPR